MGKLSNTDDEGRENDAMTRKSPQSLQQNSKIKYSRLQNCPASTVDGEVRGDNDFIHLLVPLLTAF